MALRQPHQASAASRRMTRGFGLHRRFGMRGFLVTVAAFALLLASAFAPGVPAAWRAAGVVAALAALAWTHLRGEDEAGLDH